MRSKAPLVLIELAVMLLVFALAAALCLKAFVWSDAQSAESAAGDRAWIAAQNAAELLKYSGGDFRRAAQMGGGSSQGESWVILYDENWNVTDEGYTYTLRAVPCESGLKYLGRAEVVVCQNSLELAALEVCWQEVDAYG